MTSRSDLKKKNTTTNEWPSLEVDVNESTPAITPTTTATTTPHRDQDGLTNGEIRQPPVGSARGDSEAGESIMSDETLA